MKQAIFLEWQGVTIGVAEENGALTNVFFEQTVAPDAYEENETPLLLAAKEEILAYFSGTRRTFDLPLKPEGTAFEQEVWQVLLTIPYGETRTYGEIAAQLQKPKASRAVGRANSRNPLSILIPCHRVIGASGKLTGYAGGLLMKEKLLKLEGRI